MRGFPTPGSLVLAALLFLHAAIHALGVMKAFGLSELPRLKPISPAFGGVWLGALLLLAGALVLLLASSPVWWVAAAAGLLASQVAVVGAWSDAKLGTIANVVLAVPTLLAALEATPASFSSRFRHEVNARLSTGPEPRLVQEADLAPLPPPVQAYLRFAGVVGKPRVENYHATFRGQIRSKPDGPWMSFTVEQQSFERPRARLFLLESSLLGLPFVAFHRYAEGIATMQVRAASLVTIVDARGQEMNQSETVTLLNDLCVLAPAALVDAGIRWETLDPQRVKAVFTNAGITVTGVLTFDDAGRLVHFYSDDRYQSADGKTYARYRWSTPLSDYRDFGGVRLAGYGEASWSMPGGELVYGRFHLTRVSYNRKGSER
jgi:hypothetical protein